MNENQIAVGMIVRYREEWCTPGERKYLHVVRENRLNPVKNTMTRWLIETINSNLFLNPIEEVDDYMIEPTGINVEDYMKEM